MKEIKNISDEGLMEHFQNGSIQAFSELYQRYSQRLLYFMYRLLQQDEALAQDKLHDVFARIIERPNSFDATRKFKPWIFMVVANECKKHYRAESTLPLEVDCEFEQIDELSLHTKLEHHSFKNALHKELQELTYEHRCTFVLRFQEDLSIKEISEIMNCPGGTVKSRIYYSLKILSKKLEVYNHLKNEVR